MNNSQRFKDIQACAKAIKLRIPFEKQYDNVFDMLDGIIELCNEPAENEENCQVVEYQVGENWMTVGIPIRQPYIEQVEWCMRKKASWVKVVVKRDGAPDEYRTYDISKIFSPTQKIIK